MLIANRLLCSLWKESHELQNIKEREFNFSPSNDYLPWKTVKREIFTETEVALFSFFRNGLS